MVVTWPGGASAVSRADLEPLYGRYVLCVPDADEAFQKAGVLFAPGKAANAGGVATSALEMSQNASRQRWSFGDSENKLREIMADIHGAAFDAAERHGVPAGYVAGAHLAGAI